MPGRRPQAARCQREAPRPPPGLPPESELQQPAPRAARPQPRRQPRGQGGLGQRAPRHPQQRHPQPASPLPPQRRPRHRGHGQ
eukprot:7772579-Alexandrium_andersonii.AAC.1